MLQAVAGPSPRSPLAQPADGRDFVAAVRAGAKRGLRVAYCPDIAGIGIEPESAVCRRAAFALRDRREVEEIDFDLSAGRRRFSRCAVSGSWRGCSAPRSCGRVRGQRATMCGPALAASTPRLRRPRISGRLWHRLRESSRGTITCSRRAWLCRRFRSSRTIRNDRRPGDADLRRLARADVPPQSDGLPVASVPCGSDRVRLAGGPADRRQAAGEEGVLALASAADAPDRAPGQPDQRSTALRALGAIPIAPTSGSASAERRYSWRSASTGSMRAARRAGTLAANPPTHSRAAAPTT